MSSTVHIRILTTRKSICTVRDVIKTEDRLSGEDDDILWMGLYFERFDQINSSYNAIRLITANDVGLDIDLTPEGGERLQLPVKVHFDWKELRESWHKTRKKLEKMAEYKWGKPTKSDA